MSPPRTTPPRDEGDPQDATPGQAGAPPEGAPAPAEEPGQVGAGQVGEADAADAADSAGPVEDGEPEAEAASEPLVLRGATVSPGLVLGAVHRKDYDLSRARADRAPLDEVESELNRFRQALEDSRAQLTDLRSRLTGKVKEDDARILDTHLAYLKDSVFIADVENLILTEQMRLDAAINKVVGDFDRIFRLVQSETLRQSAVDLRDVGIRVLRNLEHRSASDDGDPPPQEYVLVARELSIVDMFNLANERVQGIVTEGGSMTSHAAIFARSMRIPTLTGVEHLLERVSEGDFVILDATEGVLRVNPDDVVRQQYASPTGDEDGLAGGEGGYGDEEESGWAGGHHLTLDGERVELRAACGNLPEAEQAGRMGVSAVGLYRTELLYLVEKEPPSRDALLHHYRAVVAGARDVPVTFRLLNSDASLGLPYLHPGRELNPHLGRVGIRALLRNEALLRRQVQAILMASDESDVRIAIPFVVDCSEVRRLREIVFEERVELRKREEWIQDRFDIGPVIETPAALLGLRDLARESDFLLVNLDSLVQYLLAADRENPDLAESFESLHPLVIRALVDAVEIAAAEECELSVFGVTACSPVGFGHLIGAGVRHFCVPPAGLRETAELVAGLDASLAAHATRTAARASCPDDVRTDVERYHHGYAPPT